MNASSSETYCVVIQTEAGVAPKFRAGYNHALMMLRNGEAVELKVGPAEEPISIRQRKFLKDVVCKQIADQVALPVFDVHGRDTGKVVRHSKEAWAEHFRREFLGYRYEMQHLPGAKRPTPVKVRISTETLGMRRYSAYTDRVIDTAVLEYGVQFVFDAEEREAVRSTGRRRNPHLSGSD